MVLWAFVGSFYLVWLTVQDFRNKMVVDDRKNWFMMGASIMLLMIYPHELWFLLILSACLICLRFLWQKYKYLGDADINSLTWMFWGLAVIGLHTLVWFLALFIVVTLLYEFLKRVVFKTKQHTPFYFVISFSFIISALINGLYNTVTI